MSVVPIVSAIPASTSVSPPELLIVTDVFGNTPAIASFARQFPVSSLIVSAFPTEPGQPMPYPSEQLAYHAFIAGGGVAAYAHKLAGLLQEHQASLRFAIGFSAGASALWMNSASPAMANLEQAVLFYGSRIREYREILPACPVKLVFAEQEAAFEPAELVADLRRRGHAAEMLKGSRHGFMNPYSAGFCLKTQERYLKELQKMLELASQNSCA